MFNCPKCKNELCREIFQPFWPGQSGSYGPWECEACGWKCRGSEPTLGYRSDVSRYLKPHFVSVRAALGKADFLGLSTVIFWPPDLRSGPSPRSCRS
jgi:hypothetical protein